MRPPPRVGRTRGRSRGPCDCVSAGERTPVDRRPGRERRGLGEDMPVLPAAHRRRLGWPVGRSWRRIARPRRGACHRCDKTTLWPPFEVSGTLNGKLTGHEVPTGDPYRTISPPEVPHKPLPRSGAQQARSPGTSRGSQAQRSWPCSWSKRPPFSICLP
jgi:hypothetical protein